MPLRELEEIVDREFRRLPMPRAPETLLPRVMAAVHAWALRPWHARAWLTWPIWLRAASAGVFAMLAAGGAVLWPDLQAAAVEIVSAPAADIASRAAVPFDAVDAAAQSARVLWRTLFAPLVQYVFAIVVLMCVASAAFATAIKRLALEGNQV
jgi:hypothetical protein